MRKSSCSAKLAALAFALGCASSGTPAPTTSPLGFLGSYERETGVSAKVLAQLRQWNAIPDWAEAAARIREDWLASVHHNVARDGWPADLQNADVRTIQGRGRNIAISNAAHGAIGVFAYAPAYLRRIMEIVNYPLVRPGASDPNAKMLLDRTRQSEASAQLAHMLGMLDETGYIDAPTDWGGGVVFGTRFLYYHELGHLSQALNAAGASLGLQPEEAPYAYEMIADQFALAMVMLELRNQSQDLQVVGMSGIAFAMALIASFEYTDTTYARDVRRIKGAVYRVGRLIYWSEGAARDGMIAPAAVTVMQQYWSSYTDLLRQVKAIPSPTMSLVATAASGTAEDRVLARNTIVKWCAFGDCARVRSHLRAAYRSARVAAVNNAEAARVVDVINAIISQTARLEPDLGLANVLRE